MPRQRPMPVVVLAGVDRHHIEVVEGSVLLSLPEPVLLRHEIDVQQGELTRQVWDRSGLVERRDVGLDHTCLSCALRFEIVPTLVRLAQTGRWRSVTVSLPVAAEPAPLVRSIRQMVVDERPAAELVEVRSVVTCVSGASFQADLSVTTCSTSAIRPATMVTTARSARCSPSNWSTPMCGPSATARRTPRRWPS